MILINKKEYFMEVLAYHSYLVIFAETEIKIVIFFNFIAYIIQLKFISSLKSLC